MKLVAAFSAVVALGLALPAWAQEGASKVRIDDFAVPVDTAAAPRIEQLGNRADSLGTGSAQTSDRELVTPGPVPADDGPVAQLSQPGEAGPSQQLSERGESRQLVAGSVSSPDDSRPRATAPLGGSDRCDPQLETKQLEQCLRVLEQRAAEFDAPEAPQLSAEQVLLAERGRDEDLLAAKSSNIRLRLAAGDPNAEIASNQELASIYLDRTRTPPPATTDEPAVPDEARLAAILQGLQIELPPSGAP